MKWNKSINDEEWELIDRYLDGQLDEAALTSFEQRLATDADWKEKVESCRYIRLGIAESALAGQLQQYHARLDEKEHRQSELSSVKSIQPVWRWVVAACLVVGLGAGAWWFMNRPSDLEKTYLAWYQPDPGLLTAMGPAESYRFEQAMVQYKSGEYSQAAKTWSELLLEEPANDTLQYFLASALQADKEWEKAIVHYTKVVADSNNVFYNDACWYLGMIYLRNNDLIAARKWIGKSSHPQRENLLKEIK